MGKYTEEQLFQKLERADAAGDDEAAKVIADEIRAIRAFAKPTAKSPRGGKPMAETMSARADVNQPNPALQYFGNRAMDAATTLRAAGHNFARPFIGAARYAINKDAESGGESAADTANSFNQWADKHESDYQAEVPDGIPAFIGATAGNLALPIMKAPKALGLVGRVLSGAGSTAGYSAAINQAISGESGDLTAPAIVGGALPVVGAGVRASAPYLDDVSKALYQKALDAGIKPDISQISSNKGARAMLSQLGYLPLSGKGSREEANRVAFNRSVSAEYGKPVDKITREAHAAASAKNSDEFNRIRADTNISLTPKTLSELRAVRQNIALEAGKDAAKIADGWINKLVNNADNGNVSGTEYQAWAEQAAALAKTGGKDGYAMQKLIGAMEKIADDSVSPANKGAWREVKRRWAIQEALTPLVVKSPTGNVPPSQLLNAISRNDAGKTRVAKNRGGTMTDLADIGSRFLKEEADSNTASRSMAMKIIGNPLAQAAGIGAAGYGAQQQGWVSPGQLGLLGAALLANRGMLKATNSPSFIKGVPQAKIANALEKTGALPAYLLRNDE